MMLAVYLALSVGFATLVLCIAIPAGTFGDAIDAAGSSTPRMIAVPVLFVIAILALVVIGLAWPLFTVGACLKHWSSR